MELESLANRVHLSPSYLSRSFSKKMAMGIIQYVHHLRIEEACRLLRFTEKPVARIAGLVGYEEVAYFNRRFKEQLGQSPRDYRKESREGKK